jgi:uncharacterized protein (TIGR03032 family)
VKIACFLAGSVDLCNYSRQYYYKDYPVSYASAPRPAPANEPASFSSVHTNTMPDIMRQLNCSLLVSTYQAGRLIVVRPEPKGGLNTHFVCLDKPMGMAMGKGRFAQGTRNEIIEYHNVPAAASKVEPKGTHDACFVPRVRHTTGDVDIHEMDYDKDNRLWYINTRFSCLCVRNAEYSFEPKWRPWFVNAYAPEDRCHLNGLGMVDGVPKYVSALGAGDSKENWRENKRSGGVIIDIDKNDFVLEGLSMPHSPRWYQGKLYALESGNGSLIVADIKKGTWETVVELEGFTRGVDFVGDVAFIGLSQVRESNTFGGIPLTERLTERNCGIWAVNIKTGQVLGFLKFDGIVQEIFSIQVVQGAQFPAVLDAKDDLIDSTYVLPDEALKEVDFDSSKVASQQQANAYGS